MHLFGSGPILPHSLKAQDYWRNISGCRPMSASATSYKELRRDALEVERWNLLHPGEKPKASYLEQLLAKEEGVSWRRPTSCLAAGNGGALVQGLDPVGHGWFGRSDTRGALRRHFEVDAECIAFAALSQLARRARSNRRWPSRPCRNLTLIRKRSARRTPDSCPSEPEASAKREMLFADASGSDRKRGIHVDGE